MHSKRGCEQIRNIKKVNLITVKLSRRVFLLQGIMPNPPEITKFHSTQKQNYQLKVIYNIDLK